MKTIFRHAFARARGTILGWGLGCALLAAYLIAFYDPMAAQKEELVALLEAYPRELMAFFGGGNFANFFDPVVYISTYFFSYMGPIIAIFALVAGSSMIVSDEENGTLDLLLAYPVSRTAFLAGRLLSFIATTAAILTIIWVGFVLALGTSTLAVSPLQMVLPMLSLFALLMFFGTLSLMLSLWLPARRLASLVSGFYLVAGYFLISLMNLDQRLEPFAKLTPLDYFQGGHAINGLTLNWFFGLLLWAVAFTLVAWWLFQRRDIRVGGEGSWRFAWFWRRHPPILRSLSPGKNEP